MIFTLVLQSLSSLGLKCWETPTFHCAYYPGLREDTWYKTCTLTGISELFRLAFIWSRRARIFPSFRHKEANSAILWRRKKRDENEMLNSYKATAMPKKPLPDVKLDRLRTFEDWMHSSCFQRSPQLSTEICQPPTSCQPSSGALALHFQGKHIIYQPCLGRHWVWCRDQQILTEHCRESWLTISTQSPLLQGLSVPCCKPRGLRSVFCSLTVAQLVDFPWPSITSISSTSLAWINLLS